MEGHRQRRTFGRAQNAAASDPYQSGQKIKEPSICTECGCIYAAGRWRWPEPEDASSRPGSAHRIRCPACRRIHDKFPAGVLTVSCEKSRLDEAESIARNCELAERDEHALARIMTLAREEPGLRLETTDIHLPVKIGKSLERSLGGSLKIDYDEDGYFVRVDWQGPPAARH